MSTAILDTSLDRVEKELFAVENIKPITKAESVPTIAVFTLRIGVPMVVT